MSSRWMQKSFIYLIILVAVVLVVLMFFRPSSSSRDIPLSKVITERVTEADLARAAELRGQVPSPDIPKTVEGVLWLTGWHLDDHAKQIAAVAAR